MMVSLGAVGMAGREEGPWANPQEVTLVVVHLTCVGIRVQ